MEGTIPHIAFEAFQGCPCNSAPIAVVRILADCRVVAIHRAGRIVRQFSGVDVWPNAANADRIGVKTRALLLDDQLPCLIVAASARISRHGRHLADRVARRTHFVLRLSITLLDGTRKDSSAICICQ